MANEKDFTLSGDTDMYWREPGLSGWCDFGDISDSAQTGFLRYTGVDIAQGTSVLNANISFYKEGGFVGNDSLKYTVYGIDEDNTAEFSGDPSGRPLTTASDSRQTTMTPSLGTRFGIEVTSEANEIFARAGWASGNAIGFRFDDNGSNTNVRVFDTFDGDPSTDSYLTILTVARPDFYPSATSVTSPADPAKTHSYGIRIAKQGYNAITATDLQLAFTSGKPVLKAKFYGIKNVPTSSIAEVPHSLGYKGAFLVFGSVVSGIYETKKFKFPANVIYLPDKDEAFCYSYTDDDKLYIGNSSFIQGGSQPEMNTYYYVFIDDIEL